MGDESTAVLQGQLEQAVTGDAEAPAGRLLELTRDRPDAPRPVARCCTGAEYARLGAGRRADSTTSFSSSTSRSSRTETASG